MLELEELVPRENGDRANILGGGHSGDAARRTPIPLALSRPSPSLVGFLQRTRWTVLGLCCLAAFANNFVADSPEALHEELEDEFENGALGFELFFILMFVMFAIPNVIVPSFGGFLVDRLGPGIVLLLSLGGSLALGQTIVAIGVMVSVEAVVLVGRFLVGMGSEVVLTSLSTILADWFALSNQAAAISTMLAFVRLGQMISILGGSALAQRFGLAVALWATVAVVMVALLVSGVSVVILDKARQRHVDVTTQKQKEPASLGALASFPVNYWLICLMVFFGNSTFIVFCNVGVAAYMEEVCGFDRCCESGATCEAHEVAERQATAFVVGAILVSMLISPITGILVDRFALRGVLCSVGLAGFIASHLGLVYSSVSLFVPGVFVGVSFALFFPAAWDSIPVLVESSHTGLAFGIALACENLGQIAGILCMGAAREALGAYKPAFAVLAGSAAAAFLVSVVLNILDAQDGGLLNRFASNKPSTYPGSGAPRNAAYELETLGQSDNAIGEPLVAEEEPLSPNQLSL